MNRFIVLFIMGLSASLTVLAQDGSRQIIPEEFVKARPSKATASSARRPAYRKITITKNDAPLTGNYQQLGLTIWRLRGTKPTDPGEIPRIVVHGGEDDAEFMPERIAANTPMKYGEKIRLSFEAPAKGYLYVIDREQFADGTAGQPYLIFPTTRTRNGENAVAPGRIIEIPAQDDRPNFFTLKQSRADNVGELITVIVTPQPLEGITITNKAQEITPEQVKEWEQKWGGKTEQFEMMGGAGSTWTKVEQMAGADRTRDLTQNDPGPQTIYRVVVKPDAPLLVKIGLRYRKSAKK